MLTDPTFAIYALAVAIAAIVGGVSLAVALGEWWEGDE